MNETTTTILMGDPNAKRFLQFENLLKEIFGVQSTQFKSFADLQDHLKVENREREDAEAANSSLGAKNRRPSVIFITEDLPASPGYKASGDIVSTYFLRLEDLNSWHDLKYVFVTTQNKPPDWRGKIEPGKILPWSNSMTPLELREAIKQLHGYGGLNQIVPGKFVLTWDRGNRQLRGQIRSLSDELNLVDGEKQLTNLICLLIDPNQVQEIEVKSLGQGKSGAQVFRLFITYKTEGEADPICIERVLKISRSSEVWKLASEIAGHIQAGRHFSHQDYKRHLPKLLPAHLPGRLVELEERNVANEFVVNYGNWYAVQFDFLGGTAFGKFIDLETALLVSDAELETKLAGTKFAPTGKSADELRAVRLRILETIVDWLTRNWYVKGAGRKEVIMWDPGDAKDKKYADLPPYQLTSKAKGWIQAFIDGPEGKLGVRFFPDWADHAERVLRLVGDDMLASSQLGRMGTPVLTVLSPVHGDMNASNILLWLDEDHPFLIDLPFFQSAGHALQDLARLEVEVKLTLLDRQKDSSADQLRAFEHTYSQMDIWREMEDRLLKNWELEDTPWQAEGYTDNVQLCYEMVQLIRRTARTVQQNDECDPPPTDDFLMEYWPPLLYYTVRAIGFPSLSVFKRLLAVYSASSILSKLGCFPKSTAVALS